MADVCYSRLHKAVRWACKLHKNQDRDGEGALPYITHVSEVLSNLRYTGGIEDEEMLCVAALHDVVEQSEVPFAKIEDRYGARVAALVKQLTRREPDAKETKGMNQEQIWKLRSDILLSEIKRMSKDAQQVKLADRLSNIRNAYQTKIGGKLERTLKQTEEILKIIPRSVNPGLWDAIQEEMSKAPPAHAVASVVAHAPHGKNGQAQKGAGRGRAKTSKKKAARKSKDSGSGHSMVA